ncbi:putative F-box/FBD/LRR-repeat protein-like, partial [Capsicum annuum]
MPPKRVKKGQSVTSQKLIDGEDIINDLPRNNKCSSNKWISYYSTILEFVFDDQFFKELHNFATTHKKIHIRSEIELEQKYKLDKIVTRFLMFHPGCTEKFQVCIPNSKSTRVPKVNKWFRKLFEKNIKKLFLELKEETESHKLPSYFLSCLDLTYLKLRIFHFSTLPPEFKGFLYLEELEFLGAHHVNDYLLENLLSSCPVLQKLMLHRCSGVHHFNTSGSKLERFSM